MAPLSYRLRDRALLAQLMAHPGRGTAYTTASLAEAAEISRSMVGHLLTGEREGCAPEMAHRITDALGVGLLVLFAPPPGPSRARSAPHDGRSACEASGTKNDRGPS